MDVAMDSEAAGNAVFQPNSTSGSAEQANNAILHSNGNDDLLQTLITQVEQSSAQITIAIESLGVPIDGDTSVGASQVDTSMRTPL